MKSKLSATCAIALAASAIAMPAEATTVSLLAAGPLPVTVADLTVTGHPLVSSGPLGLLVFGNIFADFTFAVPVVDASYDVSSAACEFHFL